MYWRKTSTVTYRTDISIIIFTKYNSVIVKRSRTTNWLRSVRMSLICINVSVTHAQGVEKSVG